MRPILVNCMILLTLFGGGSAFGGEKFQAIYNGESLQGWDGDPDFWSVEDGAVTGQFTKQNPLKGKKTFIIWRGGEVGDFELTLEYRIFDGNSGIQYRSFEVKDERWIVGGYQADFDANNDYTGDLHEERLRDRLAARGQKTVVGKDGKPQVVGSVGNAGEILTKIKQEDWNTYHIIARGNCFIHKINGVTTSECRDEYEGRRSHGLIAFQLHAGPPMKVQFRNIRLKHLKKRSVK